LLAIAAPGRAQDDAQVYKPGNGVISPKLLKEVKPSYPPEAMNAGIGGSVRMECVVRPDGTPGDIRVVESLDPALDAEAMRALKEWRFIPGQKDGVAVPVIVEVEMSFTTLRGPRVDSPDVFKSGPGITLPKLVHETKPTYTPAARSAGIQGNVVVACVILTDGTVGDVRVTKHLDPDLDAEAIRTVRQWTFSPGEKEGQAVPVQVSIELTFSLR
jgi:TonB family protein